MTMTDLRKIKEELDKLDLSESIQQQIEVVQSGQFVAPTASGPPRIRVFIQDQDELFFLQFMEQREVAWSALLDLLLPEADTVAFRADSCTRFDLGPEAVAWQWTPSDALKPYLRAEDPAPGQTGIIYTFALTPDVLAFLRSVPSLSDWHVVRQLPEDPALFGQAQPLLRSISHEDMVWARLTTTDLQALQAAGILVEFTAST